MSNRYFILPSVTTDDWLRLQRLVLSVPTVVEAELSDLRYATDGKQTVVKLAQGVTDTPADLQGFTEYDHAGILAVLAGPEWQEKDP